MAKRERQNVAAVAKRKPSLLTELLQPSSAKIRALWVVFWVHFGLLSLVWLLLGLNWVGGDIGSKLISSTLNVLFFSFWIPELIAIPFQWLAHILGAIVAVVLLLALYYLLISLVIYYRTGRKKSDSKYLDLKEYFLSKWLRIIFIVLVFVLMWGGVSAQKQNLSPKIMDDLQYCTNRLDNPDCVCQSGYYKQNKWWEGRNDCVPRICKQVHGMTGGHRSQFNDEFCEWAVRQPAAYPCNYISYTYGQEVCLVAYVGRTNDTTVCGNITSLYLKQQCYLWRPVP